MTRIAFYALAVAALLGAVVPSAAAQRACQEKRDEGAGLLAGTASCREAQLPSPDANAPTRGEVPAGFISADKDDSEVQIQAGKRLRPSRTWGQHSLGVVVAAPLSEGPLSPLAELRGALPGTSLELSLTGVRWPTVPGGTGPRVIDWCRRRIPGRPCTQSEIETNHPGLIEEFLHVSGFRRPMVYHASVRAAYDEHEFLEETSLEGESRRLVPFTLNATLGRFWGATLLTINGRYERRFGDGDEIEVCTPVGVGTAERCTTARLGEPRSSSGSVITGQARRFLSASTAVNARAAYRLDDQAWSVEAPFYFIPDADGTLIAGIVPGWSSESDEFTVRLFVGQAFGLRAK